MGAQLGTPGQVYLLEPAPADDDDRPYTHISDVCRWPTATNAPTTSTADQWLSHLHPDRTQSNSGVFGKEFPRRGRGPAQCTSSHTTPLPSHPAAAASLTTANITLTYLHLVATRQHGCPTCHLPSDPLDASGMRVAVTFN